ncbi:hypothetical protein J5X98_19600 [Leptothermofonsia sichuanensis E412]|nr:hypothetical protein [Leptothermofonsia sichuanensis]QZZ19532.1 hypothetical protein J5X98_19600 [Leptothermofonsia sichuanensis E412]
MTTLSASIDRTKHSVNSLFWRSHTTRCPTFQLFIINPSMPNATIQTLR